ncbi:MAG: hypothetical protein NVSMB6_30580 [Burkholderiaceae bacterium]
MLLSVSKSPTERLGAAPTPAWTPVLIWAAIVTVFFHCAGFGLKTALGDDDVMNITFAWEPKLRELALGLLVPFTPFYRPMGAAVYRSLFELFGLSALPFRLFIYGLLLVNIFLVYRLARRLSASIEIGMVAALLFTYHGRLSGIYLNNGTLYDVLCATLTLLTLLYYFHVRQQHRFLKGWQWPAFLALFTCALNAKEMAAVIPLLLFSYELIYHSPILKSARGVATWFFYNALPALLCGILTVLAARAKMGEGSVMHGNQPYAMTFTLHWFLEHWRLLMSHLVYAREPGISQRTLLALWLVIILAAALARKRYVWIFACFALMGPLPVIFIPYRGFFVMYLPLAGWAMLIASLLVLVRDWILAQMVKSSRPEPWKNALRQVSLVASIVLFTIWIAGHDPSSELDYVDPSKARIERMRADILGLRAPVPRDGQVLFLHDRFPADSWGPLMICRLLYRDRYLRVDRPTMMKTPPNKSDYGRVFDYVGDRLVLVRARQAQNGSEVLLVPE